MKKTMISLALAASLGITSMGHIAYSATSLEQNKESLTENLTDEQINSIVMLNYLTVLTQSINSSNNNRLYLEEAYSSLLSNTKPKSIDSDTQYYLNNLLDTLEGYRMVNVKRDRIQYLYEQSMAQLLKEAVPDPTGLLAGILSVNMTKMASSIAYMALNSAGSYKSAEAQVELDYLQDGWNLDDEEAEMLHNSRKQLFNYMIDMAHQYELPDDLTISEAAVAELVKWQNNPNKTQRLQFLETNQKTYAAFGGYWLTLAKTYYEQNRFGKCLDAVHKYEGLKVNIFRKDHEYAKVLPLAICCAQKTETEKKYVEDAAIYAKKICDNTDNDDWALKYYAAVTYIDLYNRTGDEQYRKKAYDITLNNVNHLVNEQKRQNNVYLAEVSEQSIPKDADKQQKKDIKQYNRMLKEERKKELAPIYGPLQVNCDLLFALAEDMEINTAEKNKIEGIIRGDGKPLFLVQPLEDKYKFDAATQETKLDISFDGNELLLPLEYLTANTSISVRVLGDTGEHNDWNLNKVDRKKNEGISQYRAEFKCDSLKKFKYAPGDIINISIKTSAADNYGDYYAQYKAITKKVLVKDTIDFVRTE